MADVIGGISEGCILPFVCINGVYWSWPCLWRDEIKKDDWNMVQKKETNMRVEFGGIASRAYNRMHRHLSEKPGRSFREKIHCSPKLLHLRVFMVFRAFTKTLKMRMTDWPFS